MSRIIYLDTAAATPVDRQVQATMKPYLGQQFYNPSASYLAAKNVRNNLEVARSKVAIVLGARPSEIIFTAGATEANNLALLGVAAKYPGSEIISTAIEHASVLEPLGHLKSKGHNVKLIKPNNQGLVESQKIAAAVTDKTVLVSVMYANNEIGTIQPIREIAELLSGIRKVRYQVGNRLPLYLHTDAAQAANYLDLHVKRLGVDLMSVNGGKIYGPKQSGALYIGREVIIEPIIFGGGQERGLRSGTENVAGCIGFAAALELTQSIRQGEVKRLSALQKTFFEQVKNQIPQAKVNGSLKNRLPNNIHLTIPDQDNERLLFALDDAGVLAAAGSACSVSDDEASHVLKAIGVTVADARSSLRFTMGRQTSEADIRRTASLLAGLV